MAIDFTLSIARTEDDPDLPQAANSAFIVDIPSEGWTEVREVETMHGSSRPPAVVPARAAARAVG